jgi:predicted metal-dependent hydrolase
MAKAAARNQPLLSSEELQARLGEVYQALEEFNDGYYFESHETLEGLWLVTPWPERQFLQGVIQLAAAFVHVARGEYAGTIKLLDAAADKLREFVPRFLGVDVAALLESIRRTRDELTALGPERLLEWDEANVPRISFQRPAGVRT